MAQLFPHILQKAKEVLGEVTVTDVSERTTVVSLSDTELLDLLVHFVCEKSGLQKKDMTSIRLHPSLYGRTDINHSLIAHFKQTIDNS